MKSLKIMPLLKSIIHKKGAPGQENQRTIRPNAISAPIPEQIISKNPAGLSSVEKEGILARSEEEAPPGFTYESASFLHGKKVLVVEDDGILLNSAILNLQKTGATVQGAMSIGTAVKHAKNAKFDVLVFDFNLCHDEIGTDAARQIKEIYSEMGHFPVMVAFSSAISQVLKVSDAASLFHDFLNKSSHLALAYRINKALAENKSQ